MVKEFSSGLGNVEIQMAFRGDRRARRALECSSRDRAKNAAERSVAAEE